MTDWSKIKSEYIRGGISYRNLAKKHGVSLSSLTRRSCKEKWADLREQKENIASTKIVESEAIKDARRVDKMQTVADMLLDKINKIVDDGSMIKELRDIKTITASLKDLKEIKGYKTELEIQEQMARIEKLRREAVKDEVDNEIRVVISSELEDYAK